MKVSHQQFPSFGNRFLAAYRGEVYHKPRGLPVKASLEGNYPNIHLEMISYISISSKYTIYKKSVDI